MQEFSVVQTVQSFSEVARDIIFGAQTEIVAFVLAVICHLIFFKPISLKKASSVGKRSQAKQTFDQRRLSNSSPTGEERDAAGEVRELIERKLGNSGGSNSCSAEATAAAFRQINNKTQVHYNVFFDACVRFGARQAAELVVEDAKSLGMINAYVFHSMIKLYIQAGDTRRARQQFQEMRRAGVTPTSSSFNDLLNSMVRHEPAAVWSVLTEMKESNIKLSRITCSILLKLIEAGSEPRRVEQIVGFMDEMDDSMDEVLLSSVAEACIRTHNKELLLKVLRSQYSNKRVDLKSSHAFGSVIRAFGYLQDMAMVWSTWKEMKERHVALTPVTLGCMVEAVVANGDPDGGMDLIQEVEADPQTRQLVNVVMYCSVLKGFSRQKKFHRTWAVYEQLRAKEDMTLTIVTFNALIDACARCGEMERVHGLLNDMLQSSIEPNVITYSTVIKGYCQEGRVDQALRVFDDMCKEPTMKPDEHTYNTVINGCARHNLFEKGVAILEGMCEAGVKPSNFTLSVVVKLAGRSQGADKAFQVCDDLCHKYRLRPNVHVYNNLISACKKEITRAIQVLEKMVRERVQPDVRTYSLLLTACIDARAPQAAAQILRAAFGLEGTHVSLAFVPAARLRPTERLPSDLIRDVLKGIASACREESLAAQLASELRLATAATR